MNSNVSQSWLPLQLGSGLTAGLAIAYVDNCTFGGEVSPIVVVAMLFAATAVFGLIWDRQAWTAAAAAWLCLPLSHLIKHMLGLADTLQPNTYSSILKLAAFSLVIAVISLGCGVFLRRLIKG
jgi:hypothetical protein